METRLVLKTGIFLLSLAVCPLSAAKSYLVYRASKELKAELAKDFGARDVFTPAEKEFLEKIPEAARALKLELSDKERKALAKRLKNENAKIESNPSQTLFASEPYEDLQWALSNKGSPLTEWESDIDVSKTPGKEGEDLGIAGIKEDLANMIKVAVIDSGIDPTHPDLKDAVLTKPAECEALEKYRACLAANPDREACHREYSSFDADGNGYPMDCAGWNISGDSIPGAKVDGAPDMSDSEGHGTHVAGVIAARRNGEGIAGAAQSALLIPVKVGVYSSTAGDKEAPTDKIAKALLYAIQSGAQVVNLSLGWRFEQDSLLMRRMIELALSKNILVVAAAGNGAHNAPVYPCSYEGVICVGSHTVDGSLSDFSNYAAHIDIAAPGSKILSAWPSGKRSRSFTREDAYEYMSGTSQAAPYVSALLARLLNLGFSPEQAKVKLFTGARPFASGKGLYIRNGKADLSAAIESKADSVLYPANKSPALVKWTEASGTRSFKLKLRALGGPTKAAQIKLEEASKSDKVRLQTQKIAAPALEKNEVFETKVYFEAPYAGHGEFLFKASVNGRQFHIQAKAVNIFDGESPKSGQALYSLGKTNGLKDAAINKFENVGDYAGTDLLAGKPCGEQTCLSLLKQNGQSYVQSEWRKIPEASPVFLNLSKVDADLDGTPEYVAVLVNVKDKQRKSQFYVFDQNFAPKKMLIAPKNVYDNVLSAMPGKFVWLKHRKRMVPAWIGVGKRPLEQRPEPGPWDAPEPELKINRLYLLTPQGPRTVAFPGEEELPLHLLYQDRKSKAAGSARLLSGDSFGHYKNYSLYRYENGLVKEGGFKLSPYMDLLNAKPLPLANAEGDHAFFQQSSLKGARVLAVDIGETGIKLKQTRLAPKSGSPIKRVLSFDGEKAIYQTATELVSGNSALPSKTGVRRISHEILTTRTALYLRSAASPGLTGELISLNEQGKIQSPANWMTLAVEGCEETGFAKESGNGGIQEKLLFACPGKGIIIKQDLNKGFVDR